MAAKSSPGGDIVTTGSIRLVYDLIAAGPVDGYRLFVYPVRSENSPRQRAGGQ